MNQKKYMLDLLRETWMSGAKDIDTPMEVGLQFYPSESELIINNASYWRLIGKLIYLTTTRPDITFTVNKFNQFMQNLIMAHILVAQRMLKYLHKIVERVLYSQRVITWK